MDDIRLKVLLYLYFDSQESKIKNRIIDINNRLIKSCVEIDDNDLIELYRIKIELQTLSRVERQLHELFDL